jgi:hypothetical protein
MIKQVRLEMAAFRVRITNPDESLYTPKSLKIPAKRNGNTGATNAVGPLGVGQGEAKPFPVAIECATLPISHPKANVDGFRENR